MLATLSPDDWTSGSGKFVLSLNQWFEKHFNKLNKDGKKDYTFLMGSISSIGNQTKSPYIYFHQNKNESI